MKDRIKKFKNDPNRVLKAAIIGYALGSVITSVGFRKYKKLPEGTLVISFEELMEMIDQDTVKTFDNGIHAFVLAPLQSFDPDKLTKFRK